MKTIICYILGIRSLKPQLDDLQKTIDSMQFELTEMHKSYNRALEIIKLYETSDKSKPWYENDEILRDAEWEVRSLAHDIRRDKDRKIAHTHPSLKKHIWFHGGCGGCRTPLVEGIGSCTGCYYFNNINNAFPDLSKKYSLTTVK